jgi:hypothetical protein
MTTLSKQSVILGVDDVKIFALNEDSAGFLDYALMLDVPGIQRINMSPNFTERGLKGDGKILDYYIQLDTIGFSFDSAKVDLDVLAILEGGNLNTIKDGNNVITAHEYTVGANSVPKYFKIEGKAEYTGGEGGDFHFKLFKCRANSVLVEYRTQDYAIVSVTGIAIPTTHNGDIKQYRRNPESTPIG